MPDLSQSQDRLVAMTYRKLREIAGHHLAGESSHTLQPTELVHEAYERMLGLDMPFEDKQHYISLSSTMMRRILVDHARRRNSQKRGCGHRPLTLRTDLDGSPAQCLEIFRLDELLDELERLDSRKAKVAELHYFVGLTQQEIADLLTLSPATIFRELRFVRSWFQARARE